MDFDVVDIGFFTELCNFFCEFLFLESVILNLSMSVPTRGEVVGASKVLGKEMLRDAMDWSSGGMETLGITETGVGHSRSNVKGFGFQATSCVSLARFDVV